MRHTAPPVMDTNNILEKINKASLKFLAPLSLEDTYQTIVAEALKLVGGDDGMIVREIDGELQTVFGSTPSAASYKVRKNGNSRLALSEHKAIVLHAEDIKKLSKKNVKS